MKLSSIRQFLRMVLLLVIDVKYFNISGAIIFLSLARAKLEMAKRNFPSH